MAHFGDKLGAFGDKDKESAASYRETKILDHAPYACVMVCMDVFMDVCINVKDSSALVSSVCTIWICKFNT